MLIKNAMLVLKKAWSVKLAVLSAVFSAAEVSLPFFTGVVPPGILASAALIAALGSATMRIVYQPALNVEASGRAT